MIGLTRVTGEKVIVNCDLVLFVEETPDTLITFRDGQRLLVREKADDVVKKAMVYRRLTRAPWSQKER